MIYCFDIDGTICDGANGNYPKAHPLPDRIAAINRLYDAGHTIILHTARGSVTGEDWMDVTMAQLAGWGLKYHEMYFNKPYADAYIDDKAHDAEEWFAKVSGTGP